MQKIKEGLSRFNEMGKEEKLDIALILFMTLSAFMMVEVFNGGIALAVELSLIVASILLYGTNIFVSLALLIGYQLVSFVHLCSNYESIREAISYSGFELPLAFIVVLNIVMMYRKRKKKFKEDTENNKYETKLIPTKLNIVIKSAMILLMYSVVVIEFNSESMIALTDNGTARMLVSIYQLMPIFIIISMMFYTDFYYVVYSINLVILAYVLYMQISLENADALSVIQFGVLLLSVMISYIRYKRERNKADLVKSLLDDLNELEDFANKILAEEQSYETSAEDIEKKDGQTEEEIGDKLEIEDKLEIDK